MGKNIEFAEFQQIAKDVLKQVADFCEENGLVYFLSYGTLLGAVRHKDMIPWDYDIDIAMPRPDFERFLQMTSEKPINEHLTVFSWKNERNYYIPFIKVCDNRTRLVITKTRRTKIPLGIWVDIFPLDGCSDDMDENRELQKTALSFAKKAMMPFYATHSLKETLYQLLPIVRSWFVPSCKYIHWTMDVVKRYDYESSDLVGVVASLDWAVEKEIAPKSHYAPMKHQFGEYEFTIPAGYHELLTQFYGDYMQLPPEENRAIPKIQSYWVDK